MRWLVALVILCSAILGAAWLRPVAAPTWRALAPELPVEPVGNGQGIVRTEGTSALVAVAEPAPKLRPEVNATATAVEQPSPMPNALSSTLCPEGMAWVSGEFCPAPPELMLGERGCPVAPWTIGACMDVFEYPNVAGVLPAVMLRADEANQVCKAEGKRLCRESEWTFACRSTREPERCNFGHAAEVRVERLWNPASVSREVADHDGRRPSHETGCVDDFGVHDLLGNVQEWALSDMPEYRVALKGGRYNQGRETCDRSLHVTDPWLRYPHTGLRCCRDPLVQLPDP